MISALTLVLAVSLATPLLAQSSDIGPPGTLVAVGGRKAHVLCSGEGAPTVVLEAGASAFAIDWALVQPEIARRARRLRNRRSTPSSSGATKRSAARPS
jgi:hypothetical protein